MVSPKTIWLIYAALVAVTLAVYWPARHFDFINYDDPDYVYENVRVLRGVSSEGVSWAFGQVAGKTTYWHPLTWLSLMLDTQIFGPAPGPLHLVNVLFHAGNAALLFFVLRSLTGSVWRSAVVSGLFAWHPLQVDTVAWISERKNVLSTFFWLLTFWAYGRYAAESKIRSSKFKVFYALTLLFFALGLMAKPMLVTTPLLLLILDFWPLGRMQGRTLKENGRLLVEKVPLFVLSAASAVITVVAHQRLKSLASTDQLSLVARLGNAMVSYARYLRKMVWPSDLAVLYPHPGTWPVLVVIGASLVVVAVSVWVVWSSPRRSYLLAGWLWFLTALLPVIGIIQASSQSMADRFAYVPLIGLFILLVWLAADLLSGWRYRMPVSAVLAMAVLGALLAASSRQLRYWHNSETVFRHALAVTGGNDIIHYNLACALARSNQLDEAVREFHASLKLNPGTVDAHINLGVVLQLQGRKDEAMAEFAEVVRRDPSKETAHNNLGLALQEKGKVLAAMAEFAEALRLNPDYAQAHNNLGMVLNSQGKTNEALAHFAEAVRLKPDYDDALYNMGQICLNQGKVDDAMRFYLGALGVRADYAEAHYQLGSILAARKKTAEAIVHFRAAVRSKPDWLEAVNNLSWILATQSEARFRDGPESVRLALHAVVLSRTNNAGALDTLAAAYAEAGRFPAAISAAEKALALAGAGPEKGLGPALRERLKIYQSGQAYRE